MTDDEFDKLMTKIAKELPDQANSEMLALIIINIIRLYDQQANWPIMMLGITKELADIMENGAKKSHDPIDAVADTIDIMLNEQIAIRDVDNFFARLRGKSNE
jgi:hypothetical protein